MPGHYSTWYVQLWWFNPFDARNSQIKSHFRSSLRGHFYVSIRWRYNHDCCQPWFLLFYVIGLHEWRRMLWHCRSVDRSIISRLFLRQHKVGHFVSRTRHLCISSDHVYGFDHTGLHSNVIEQRRLQLLISGNLCQVKYCHTKATRQIKFPSIYTPTHTAGSSSLPVISNKTTCFGRTCKHRLRLTNCDWGTEFRSEPPSTVMRTWHRRPIQAMLVAEMTYAVEFRGVGRIHDPPISPVAYCRRRIAPGMTPIGLVVDGARAAATVSPNRPTRVQSATRTPATE